MAKTFPSLPPVLLSRAPHRFDDALGRTYEVRMGRRPELHRLTETHGEYLDGLLGRPSGTRSHRRRLDTFPLKTSVVMALLAEILRLVAELRTARGENGMEHADAN